MRVTTISYGGLELEIEYSYQPAERQTLEDPGCSEEFEITKITYKGNDFTEFIEDLDKFEEVEELFFDKMYD